MATIAAEPGLPGAAAIEAAGLKAWPAHEEARDGAWVRRASGGYSKRANSVQSLALADDGDADSRIDAAVRWFEARAVKPVFRLTPLAGPGIRMALERRRWEEFEPTRVMVCRLGVAGRTGDPAIDVTAPGDATWLTAQRHLQGYDAGRLTGLEGIVSQMAAPAFGLVLRAADGAPLASAYIACVEGIAFLGNVVTAAAERRKGHARRIVEAGLGLAAGVGATVGVLQVLASNTAAQGLYRRLGYEPHYDYTHRRPA